MSDIGGLPNGSYYPPSVVDASGRRVQPGSSVAFVHSRNRRRGAVVGWVREGLVILTDDMDPVGADELRIVHPSDVTKLDVEGADPAGFFVEHGGPLSVLVQSIGTRDVVLVGDAELGGYTRVLPTADGFRTTDVSGMQNRPSVRQWTREIAGILGDLGDAERREVIRREVRAPILERVLQGAVLPRRLERLVLLVTDQVDPEVNQNDTVFSAEILRHWLEAHDHLVGLGVPNDSRRWINELRVETVGTLPHVIDAVTHRLKSSVVDWTTGAGRLVVVHGGGTPAMNVGVLIAAAQYSEVPVRHIQVPEPRAGGSLPPLIEMDLDLMPELGRALGQG